MNTFFQIDKTKLHNELYALIDIQEKEKKFTFKDFYDKANQLIINSGLFNLPHIQHKIILPQFNGIGDAILTTGFVRETRKAYPNSIITYVSSPIMKQIYQYCPYINKYIGLEFPSYEPIALLRGIVDYCYHNLWNDYNDLSIMSHRGENNLVALLFSWLSGSKEVIGFGENNWWYIYTEEENKQQDKDLENLVFDNCILTNHVTPPLNIKHDTLAKYFILYVLGKRVQDMSLECWLAPNAITRADKLTNNIQGKKIAIGIGGTFGAKKYPINKYIYLLNRIYEYESIKPIFFIVGGNIEYEEAEKIIAGMPKNSCINFTYEKSVEDTLALISKMDMYIGNDTSAIHMASVFGIPIIGLNAEAKDNNDNDIHLLRFSSFHRFRPWTTNAVIIRPLHELNECRNLMITGHCKFDHPHCITQIKPKYIFEVYKAVVENNMNADINTNYTLQKLTFDKAGLN